MRQQQRQDDVELVVLVVLLHQLDGPGADSKVAALVPAAIKSKGTLTVAADASYAPNEFIGSDGKTVEGMDADLAKALAEVMGLKVTSRTRPSTASSPASPPTSTTSDVLFTDTKERQKTVDFVTYFSAGTPSTPRHRARRR